MKVPEIIEQLAKGNILFTQEHSSEYFDEFRQQQAPYITLVTCSDSRVPLQALMPDTSNRVFTIKNIGNQILSTEGSVDYGIYHLKTPVLLILGHSDCGAIRAYLKGFYEETFNIKHELDFLRPLIKDNATDTEFSTMHTHAIEHNLDYQVNIACKKYKDLIAEGKLTVIGAYYDFAGAFGKGQGRIVIVNVNKQRSETELRAMPLFDKLSLEEKDVFIGRLLT
jgi:carbonic anhydrase